MFNIVNRLRHRILNAVHHVGERIQQMLKPSTISLVAGAAKDAIRSRAHLVAGNAILRQQLIILQRHAKRPQLSNPYRIRLLLLARATPFWKQALHIVQPDTLLRWHRQLFRLVWRRKSKPKTPQSRITPETIALIRQMRMENVTWGAERIRGELRKLGINVSKRTVQRYLPPETAPSTSPSNQNRGTLLRNHAHQIWSCDFTQTYSLFFAPLFVFVIIVSSRRIVHTAVTAHPTDAWVAQQLREATPWGEHPRFLIRDNNNKYRPHFAAVAADSGVEIIRTPIRAPNANSICERMLGSLHRECLDHVLILNEHHLTKVVREYGGFFNHARPHQAHPERSRRGIGQAIPVPPKVEHPQTGKVIAFPVLGGLHHDYRRAA